MNKLIDWDQVPDIMNKEKFYRICHISKQTARYLLQSGLVPCKCSGKKTRCYSIKKEDVQEYLRQREIYPEKYTIPAGCYGKKRTKSTGMPKKLSNETLKKLHSYYTALLVSYPNVMDTNEIVALTGYCRDTVNKWCCKNYMVHFVHRRTNYIPKEFLIDFFCSEKFRSISCMSRWHIHTLQDFNRRLRDELCTREDRKKRESLSRNI